MRLSGRQWVYRFYRRELSGSLLAVAIVSGTLILILVFLVSPGFAFPRKQVEDNTKITLTPSVNLAGTLNDTEPLFLATPLNYSAKFNTGGDLGEQNLFLAFGGVFYINHNEALFDDGLERERAAGLRLLNDSIVSPLGKDFAMTLGQAPFKTTSNNGDWQATIEVRSRQDGRVIEKLQVSRILFSSAKLLLEPLVIFAYGLPDNRMFMVEHSSGDHAVDQRVIDYVRDWARTHLLQSGSYTFEIGF